MNISVKCISCRFALPDKSASERGWKAYECTNPNSEYHKSLLNVRPGGERLKRISWGGCTAGERKESGVLI